MIPSVPNHFNRPALRRDFTLLLLPGLALAFSALALTVPASAVVCNITLLVMATCVMLNLMLGILRWGRSVELGWIVFQLGILFWFVMPGVNQVIEGDRWAGQAALISAGPADFTMAMFIVCIFNFLFGLGYYIGFPQRLFVYFKHRWVPDVTPNSRSSLLVPIVLLLGALAFYIVLSGGLNDAVTLFFSGRYSDKPWLAQGNYGTTLSSFHNAVASLRVVLSIFFGCQFLLAPLSPRQRMVALFLWVLAALSVAVESGTRAQLIMCFGPPMLLYIRNSFFASAASRVKAITITLLLAMALAFVGSFLRTFRNQGDVDAALESSQVTIEDNAGLLHVAFAYRESRLVPPTHDSVLLHIMTGPIPRFLWPSKPELKAMNVHSLFVWGVDITRTGGNTLPYIPGQYMIAWGWLGLLEVSFFLGIFLSFADKLIWYSRSLSVHILSVTFSCYIFVVFRMIGFYFFFPIFILLAYIQYQRWRVSRMRKSRPRGFALPRVVF